MNWKEQRRTLIIPIIGGSIMSLFIGLVGSGNTSALFLNLATDGFTVLITIFVVEKILDHYRKEASAGTRFVAYREVCWINNRFLAFWEEVLVHSIDCGGTIDSPFSNNSIAAIYRSLDLQSEAPVYPSAKWIDYIDQVGARQKRDIENVLMRYSTFLPDNIVERLGNLEHALFFKIVSRNFIGDSPSIAKGIIQTSMFDELAENVPRLNEALIEMDLEFSHRTRHIPPRKLDEEYCKFVNAKIQARQ
jgi:hypothetical protein